MIVESKKRGGRFRAAISARPIQLAGLAVLAGMVLARLGLITYWSWHDASRSRLIVAWCLGIVVIAMLVRLASHVISGKQQLAGKTDGRASGTDA